MPMVSWSNCTANRCTALRLAKRSGTSPDLWLNGQLALGLYRPINDEKETEKLE